MKWRRGKNEVPRKKWGEWNFHFVPEEPCIISIYMYTPMPARARHFQHLCILLRQSYYTHERIGRRKKKKKISRQGGQFSQGEGEICPFCAFVLHIYYAKRYSWLLLMMAGSRKRLIWICRKISFRCVTTEALEALSLSGPCKYLISRG